MREIVNLYVTPSVETPSIVTTVLDRIRHFINVLDKFPNASKEKKEAFAENLLEEFFLKNGNYLRVLDDVEKLIEGIEKIKKV